MRLLENVDLELLLEKDINNFVNKLTFEGPDEYVVFVMGVIHKWRHGLKGERVDSKPALDTEKRHERGGD